MNVEFPQYAARMETEGEPPNVTITVRCPLCDKVVVQRSWVGFAPPGPDAEVEILVGADERRFTASDAELQSVVDARLRDAAEDKKVYWAHLAAAHAEHLS